MNATNEFTIGTDLNFAWSITDQAGVPYLLGDKKLVLELINGRGCIEVKDISVDGNLLTWSFPGKEQKAVGAYGLRLTISAADDRRMVTVSKCDVFHLVAGECREDNTTEGLVDSGLNGVRITIGSEVAIINVMPTVPVIGENGNWWVDGKDTGKPAYLEAGMSAYEIAKVHGFEGTEEEWLASLKAVMIPEFDIIKSSGLDSVIYNGADAIHDNYPCLRFLGEAPTAGWSIQVLVYRNKGTKKYKKILECSIEDCEFPQLWKGEEYQSIVLPWRISRIFWEMFDPLAVGEEKFHEIEYNDEQVRQAFLQACKNNNEIKKYASAVRPRQRGGSWFSGSFGIRIINREKKAYGNIKYFRITLHNRTNSDTSFIATFDIKIDSGLTVTSYNLKENE